MKTNCEKLVKLNLQITKVYQIIFDFVTNCQIQVVYLHINLFDAYAVMIFFKDYKLGYIPRSENKEISKLLEMGHNDIFEVRINQIDPHADPEHQIGVIVKLEKKSKFFLICALY